VVSGGANFPMSQETVDHTPPHRNLGRADNAAAELQKYMAIRAVCEAVDAAADYLRLVSIATTNIAAIALRVFCC
jgi:hypothetical protein